MAFALLHYIFGQAYVDSLRTIANHSTNEQELKEATLLLAEYLVQRNPEQAEIYADEVLELPNTPSDSMEWTRINYIYAASHRWQGNYATALDYYQKNYQYFNSVGDKRNIARSGTKIGTLNTFLGNNVIAQRYLLESAEIYNNEVGMSKEKAGINSRLAGLYLNLGQIEKGKDRFIQALEAYTIIQDSAGMASTNANLGYVYSELGDLEKAEAHLLAQKVLNKVFPTAREMGFHHDFMGLLRQKQGRLEDAYQEHLTALKIREGLSSTYNLCESRLHTGEVLIKLKRYGEAISHLEEVLTYEEHNSLNQESEAHRLLSLAYEKKADLAQSLVHYKDYKAISDSIYNAESIQVIADKDAQYQKKEQDAEIRILNQENEIARQKANRSLLIIYGSLTGLVIFSLLSFFIYRLYMSVKRQKDVIASALDEKETLLKEIHHRVKNNLQVISSLLSLQSRYIEDSTAQEAVNEGKNRVKSMALIHQKLYQQDNLMGVDVLDYIQNLTTTLKSTYGIDEGKVDVKYDIQQLNFDVDTIIPIGLILNELISNAFKHAFREGRSGELNIRLKETESDMLELVVKDNGVGSKKQISLTDSFGMRMISSLAQKLEAEVDFDFTQGTLASLMISNYKLV